MEDSEVVQVAQSVWSGKQRGLLRAGSFRVSPDDVDILMMTDHDAYILLSFLRRHQGPDATFMCTNTLAERLGWCRHRQAAARSKLIALGYIKPLRQAATGLPSLFRWLK
jgi:hypothetical protein